MEYQNQKIEKILLTQTSCKDSNCQTIEKGRLTLGSVKMKRWDNNTISYYIKMNPGES